MNKLVTNVCSEPICPDKQCNPKKNCFVYERTIAISTIARRIIGTNLSPLDRVFINYKIESTSNATN